MEETMQHIEEVELKEQQGGGGNAEGVKKEGEKIATWKLLNHMFQNY